MTEKILFFDCNCLRSSCLRTRSLSRDRMFASGPAGSHLTLATHTHEIAISVQFGAMVHGSAARAPEGSARRIPLSRGVWIWFFAPPQNCKKRSSKKSVKWCEISSYTSIFLRILEISHRFTPFYTISHLFHTFFAHAFLRFRTARIFFFCNQVLTGRGVSASDSLAEGKWNTHWIGKPPGAETTRSHK